MIGEIMKERLISIEPNKLSLSCFTSEHQKKYVFFLLLFGQDERLDH